MEVKLVQETKANGDIFFKVIKDNSTIECFFFNDITKEREYAKAEALYNRILEGKNETEVIILKTNNPNEKPLL